MLFHPFQLFTIAAMFSPGLWFVPPQPPDTPPPSRRATFGYKIAAGFALSQIYWLIPTRDHCSPDFLCFLFRESQSLPALPAPRPISPRPPAPTSRAYVSSLLRRSCPAVVIPPRPAPTCRNTHVHPTFEWASQSPVPSPVLEQHSCSPSSSPTSPGDEIIHAQPSILPFSPPRPTDAAPIFSGLLLVACIIFRNSLGYFLAIVLVALVDLAKFMVPANVTRRSWRFKNVEHAARVLSGSVALGVIVLSYVVPALSANYAVFSVFVLGLTVETILAWTKDVVSDIWTSPPMNDVKIAIEIINLFRGNASSLTAAHMVLIPQLFGFDMAMNKVLAENIVANFVSKDSVKSISPTAEFDITNLKSSNKVISTVEVQAPIVQVIDGSRDDRTLHRSSEDALQQEVLTLAVDEAPDEVSAIPEPPIANQDIVPAVATFPRHEDALKRKHQVTGSLPIAENGLPNDPPNPGSSVTAHSVTEATSYLPRYPISSSPLLLPHLPIAEELSSASEHRPDSASDHLPRRRRRVRRSVKRELKAERETREAAAASTTAQASTSTLSQHNQDATDWCLVVRGRGRGRR